MKNNPLPPPAILPLSELATQAHEGTPRYGVYGLPAAPAPSPKPDTRAAGGNVFDLRNEQTTL